MWEWVFGFEWGVELDAENFLAKRRGVYMNNSNKVKPYVKPNKQRSMKTLRPEATPPEVLKKIKRDEKIEAIFDFLMRNTKIIKIILGAIICILMFSILRYIRNI